MLNAQELYVFLQNYELTSMEGLRSALGVFLDSWSRQPIAIRYLEGDDYLLHEGFDYVIFIQALPETLTIVVNGEGDMYPMDHTI